MSNSDVLTTEHRLHKLRLSPVWIAAMAGVIALLPVVVYGIPSNLDLLNHFRFALPFYDAIQQGHLHPGWLAESNFGYGDPSFRFYPPGLYYVLSIARALTGSWYVGTVATLMLLSVVASLGVYFWARDFLPAELAMWAGVFYSVAPYHTNQLYQAFLLAEFAGAAVLPFTFAFVSRVCRRGSARDVAGLSISYAALILTHLPLSVIGSVALVVYALVCFQRKRIWSTVFRLIAAVALALIATSFYWTTMIAELKWIRAYDSQSTEYSHNFIFSTFSPDNMNVWWMNILVVATLAMFWPAFVLFKKWKALFKEQRLLNCVALLLFFSIFMAAPISWPLWKLLGPIQQVQFPWRWLTVTSMAFPILLAAALPYWRTVASSKRRFVALLAAGTFAISLAFSLSHTVREAQYLNAQKFDATLRSIPGTQGVWQWWPVWVGSFPTTQMTSLVDAGSRSVTVQSWGAEKRQFAVSAGEPREIRVKTFFYPHWSATSDSIDFPVRPDKDGALLITIPATDTSITLEFKEPLRAEVAEVVSVIGFVLIAALALLSLRKRSNVRLPLSNFVR